METGALVEAVHDVRVEASRGWAYSDGYGEAQDSYRQVAEQLANGVSRAFGRKGEFAIKSGSSKKL